MLKVALDECIDTSMIGNEDVFILITEVLCGVDLLINFVTVPSDMKEPNLGKTMKLYLKSKFILDFTTTVISNVLFLFPGKEVKLWFYRLKIWRIYHIVYVRFVMRAIIEYLAASIPKIGKLIYEII